MKTARILNVIAAIFLIVALFIFETLLIYLSIAFLAASIIYWRIKASEATRGTKRKFLGK
jgi:hypothetical protein